MSIFVCTDCGRYCDADEGCEETSDGVGLICADCAECCEHCDESPVIKLDGELLCEKHADQWVRNEGVSALAEVTGDK